MFRVLAQPRWLAGLILCLSVIGGFVSLGLWQLDRHSQQETRNTRLKVAEASAGLPLDPEVYQPVVITGTWREGSTVEVVPRYRDGVLGASIVSVLRTDDGEYVAVDRGWTKDVGSTPAPGGGSPATVEGRLIESQGTGSTALAERRFARLDVGSIGSVAGVDLYPLAVIAERIQPTDERLSTDQVLIESSTPHFGYALQWFGLAGVVLVGFPLLVRKMAQ